MVCHLTCDHQPSPATLPLRNLPARTIQRKLPLHVCLPLRRGCAGSHCLLYNFTSIVIPVEEFPASLQTRKSEHACALGSPPYPFPHHKRRPVRRGHLQPFHQQKYSIVTTTTAATTNAFLNSPSPSTTAPAPPPAPDPTLLRQTRPYNLPMAAKQCPKASACQ